MSLAALNSAKIKVAVVGAGGWGRQHARVWAERPDVEFCAIAGRTPEKTAARATEYGVRAYVNIDEMLDRERPDLVSLSLPNQEHFAATLQVIEARYPLLVEKPLVFELAQADILLQAAAMRNLFFAINFNHRYARPLQLARQAIDAGRLGELVFAVWRFGGEGKSDHVALFVSRHFVWQPPTDRWEIEGRALRQRLVPHVEECAGQELNDRQPAEHHSGGVDVDAAQYIGRETFRNRGARPPEHGGAVNDPFRAFRCREHALHIRDVTRYDVDTCLS
jgi:hypothetical protein